MLSAICSNLDLFLILLSGNGLKTGLNPLPNDKFWIIPYSKSLQMIILNLMKMAESSTKWKKTLEKGEIARYEQFLLFPQFFQKTCTADT